MLRTPSTTAIVKLASAALLGVALIATPALANGKGGGNGGGNGNGGGHANSHSEGSASASSTNQDQADQDSTKLAANTLGSLNGFLHASPTALKHASPKSVIGKISVVYAGLLQGYLSRAQGATAPTAAQVAATLAAAANKPLSPQIVQAINDKLAANDPTLASAISSYKGGATGLATDIYKGA